MIRLVKLNEYGKSAVDSVNYLFKECGKNQIFKSDILLCEQNGFFFDNHPTIGPGDEGFNSVQGFNQALEKELAIQLMMINILRSWITEISME